MKNWKIYLATYLILIFAPIAMYGQENESQELVKLLNRGEFFKSKEIHRQICDTIRPELDLYYKFRMAQFMNKEDSIAIYLENIFTDYPNLFWNETINVYGILFNTYINLRDYNRGSYTYERMVTHLMENPYDINEKEVALWKNGIEDRLSYLKQLISQPPIKIERKKTNNFAKIEAGERLLLEAKINGIARKTYFDTGCDFHYIMNRKEAEEVGLICDKSTMSKGTINNAEVPTKQIMLDSIEIGNIVLYNIPTTIFESDITPNVPDSVKNNPEIMAHVDSTYTSIASSAVGLPIMKLIGKFLIDYKSEKITFPISESCLPPIKESNIFLHNSDLYTHLKINEEDFIGTLDLGFDDYILIDTAFYEKHQDNIQIDSIADIKPYFIMMPHRLWNNISYKVVLKPAILLNNKLMRPPTKESVKVYSLRPIWYGEYFDGVIGYDFFKRIGKKVLLDLDNMRLEAIK